MSRLYFAAAPHEVMTETFRDWDWQAYPVNFLVSFAMISGYNKIKESMHPQYSFLDSGAFTAKNTGKIIDLNLLCNEIVQGGWTEAAALDVIGDPEGSLKNALEMKNRGLEVLPTFHFGEPWEFLIEYKNQFKKIGLGGLVGLQFITKKKFLDQVFARAYPARFHGFGISNEQLLMKFPFVSVDSTTWYAGYRFGSNRWGKDLAYPGVPIPRAKDVGKGVLNLKHEVMHALERERRVSERWLVELTKLESL